ncbi:MAG TPA: hypothetical protein VG759_21570 [Candidatus Angelobacter sp.]|jgi:hypothetical protein|nr:hypothetical protein [Candidatus Angelobacter sp.]
MTHTNRTSASAWQVSMLTCAVFGGRCSYCNTTLSADQLFHSLYQHKSHLAFVCAWVCIITPDEYRGLELNLPVELFLSRDRQFLEDVLHLPAIVFKFSCTHCQLQKFPATKREIRSFRTLHSGHLRLARLHAVVHTVGGRPLRQTFALLGQKAAHYKTLVQPPSPSPFTMARAAQLLELCQTLHCTITSIHCHACRGRHMLKDQADIQDELPLHDGHWNYVHLQVIVSQPREYAGRELEIPAYPFSLESLLSPRGLTIHCVLLELFRQHGGPKIIPWNAAEVTSYIESPSDQRNQPRFLALVRGQGERTYQCELPVIHVHAPSRLHVTQLEQSFLQAQMEEA